MLCFFFEGYGNHRDLHVLTHSFPTRRSSDLNSSTIQIDTLTVGVDGATATAFEMLPGMGSGGGVGNGEGGSATLDIQGGSLTAGRIDLVDRKSTRLNSSH